MVEVGVELIFVQRLVGLDVVGVLDDLDLDARIRGQVVVNVVQDLRVRRGGSRRPSRVLTSEGVEEVEPPELTAGTRRIPVDKVSFADELSECGGLLQFYMPVTFDPDAVFGTHVATAENDAGSTCTPL